jgi:methionyl-tRNA formyltransferase
VLRVVFLGQKWIGDRCFALLDRYRQNGVEIVGVVTNLSADRWWATAGVAEGARALGVPVISNEHPNHDAIAELAGQADALLSVQHPWILRDELLRSVPLALNLHLAKLPTYKGYNAANHAILNGERALTVTVHHLVAEVDAGPIAYEESVAIDGNETARSLYDKSVAAGEIAFGRLLDDLLGGREPPRREQAGAPCFYARDSLAPLRELSLDLEPAELDARVRGLYFPPFEPAYVLAGGTKAYVLPARFGEHAHEFRRPAA